MVRYALPFTDDGGASFYRFCSLRAEVENFELAFYFMFYVRKCILNASNYQLNRCFPEIAGASYGDKFADLTGPDDFTRLPLGVFWWLINIRLGYLIFRHGNSYTIEPYMPSRFARQFAMINYISATPTLASSAKIYLKVPRRGTTAWLEGQKLFSALLTRRPIVILALVSVPGTP